MIANIKRIGDVYKIMCILCMLMSGTLHSSDSTAGRIPLPNPTGGDEVHPSTFDAGEAAAGSNEDSTTQSSEFTRTPDNDVSIAASAPSLSRIHHSDVFRETNETSNWPAGYTWYLKETFLRLGDQQFFDFCMQLPHFPGTISELKSFFEKLGIYDSYAFNIHVGQLLEFEECREKIGTELLWHLRSRAGDMFQAHQILHALYREKTLKNVEYFRRTIIKFDNTIIREQASVRQIDWEKSYAMSRFFRFIIVLYQLSIRSNAPNKEHIITYLDHIVVNFAESDALGVLKRRSCSMRNVKYLTISNFSGNVGLEFLNPKKLTWVEISGLDVVDLTSHNMRWILRHKNIEVLMLISKEMMLNTEFKKLNQLKELRKLVIALEGKPGGPSTPGHTSSTCNTATSYKQPASVDLCEMEKLQSFSMSNSMLGSLALRKMSELREFALKGCWMELAHLQDISVPLSVSLDSCHLSSLALQNVYALRDLKLAKSTFGTITINSTVEVESLSIEESSFEALDMRDDISNSTSNGLVKIVRMKLSKCSFESVNLQGVQSIRWLEFSECDLSRADSIWESLTAVKSLKHLLIRECAGLRKLPYQISEIKGLETLYISLPALDPTKYILGSVDMCLAFRFPKTLQMCSICIWNGSVEFIQGRWFENCDRSQLKLIFNQAQYIVTDDYRVVKRE